MDFVDEKLGEDGYLRVLIKDIPKGGRGLTSQEYAGLRAYGLGGSRWRYKVVYLSGSVGELWLKEAYVDKWDKLDVIITKRVW